MIEEEKGAIDFVVEEVYGNLKKEYGDLPKKKSTAIKPKPTARQSIELEKLMVGNQSKEDLYKQTLNQMLATKEE
jgi:hypothetical protein